LDHLVDYGVHEHLESSTAEVPMKSSDLVEEDGEVGGVDMLFSAVFSVGSLWVEVGEVNGSFIHFVLFFYLFDPIDDFLDFFLKVSNSLSYLHGHVVKSGER
jgi:hypothetical protein